MAKISNFLEFWLENAAKGTGLKTSPNPEVGKCTPANISIPENDKIQKYETLANEIKTIYKIYEVNIQTLILSQNGLINSREDDAW